MFRVFSCLTTEHDWRLVLLAGLVCFAASIVAIQNASFPSTVFRAFIALQSGWLVICVLIKE